jgi:hypothetical protein
VININSRNCGYSVDDLEKIFAIFKEDDCLAFLGAGAGSEFIDSQQNIVPGLPRGAELDKSLADR